MIHRRESFAHVLQEWEKHVKQGTIGRLTAPLGKKQKIKSMQKGLAELAAKDVMVDL